MLSQVCQCFPIRLLHPWRTQGCSTLGKGRKTTLGKEAGNQLIARRVVRKSRHRHKAALHSKARCRHRLVQLHVKACICLGNDGCLGNISGAAAQAQHCRKGNARTRKGVIAKLELYAWARRVYLGTRGTQGGLLLRRRFVPASAGDAEAARAV